VIYNDFSRNTTQRLQFLLRFSATLRVTECKKGGCNRSYLLLSNSTHKTKTLFANRWKITNSKAPGPIMMIGQIRNREYQLDHIYYTLLWQVLGFVVSFTSLPNYAKMVSQNHLVEHILTFLHPIPICRVTYLL
jgi:hypothetical protein